MAKKEYVYGFHAIQTLLKWDASKIIKLYILQNRTDHRLSEIETQAQSRDIPVMRVASNFLDSLLGPHETHQGIVAECHSISAWDESTLYDLMSFAESPVLLLILDGVQDPHNLGACLRSANAFGVNAVIIPKDRSASMTPAARKAASGAASLTPLISVINLSRTLNRLKEHNIWLIGADASAESTFKEMDLRGHVGIVLGGEGKGLRALTKKNCDFRAKIPTVGAVESLNVSVATGICLYEASRQRQ